MKIIILSLFLAASASVSLFAQTVPSGMTYQGRLTDASNAPVPDGTGYEIEVRLWSASTGGTLLWGTRYTGVPIKSGAFNLILGSGGTPIPGATHTDLKLAFNTPTVHLGLTTTKSATGAAISSPSEILPRQQIFSTPYAFRAETSATVQTDGILSAAIKDGEVTTLDIADNAITVSKLAAGVAAQNLDPQSILMDRIVHDYAIFWEEQPANIPGGPMDSTWKRRTLNRSSPETPGNGSSITRNGNTITLLNGTYFIRASAPIQNQSLTQLVLRDVTGSPTVPVIALHGTTELSVSSVVCRPSVEDYLEVVNGPRHYELWQYARDQSSHPNSLGPSVVEGSIDSTKPQKNIYSKIHIQKIK